MNRNFTLWCALLCVGFLVLLTVPAAAQSGELDEPEEASMDFNVGLSLLYFGVGPAIDSYEYNETGEAPIIDDWGELTPDDSLLEFTMDELLITGGIELPLGFSAGLGLGVAMVRDSETIPHNYDNDVNNDFPQFSGAGFAFELWAKYSMDLDGFIVGADAQLGYVTASETIEYTEYRNPDTPSDPDTESYSYETDFNSTLLRLKVHGGLPIAPGAVVGLSVGVGFPLDMGITYKRSRTRSWDPSNVNVRQSEVDLTLTLVDISLFGELRFSDFRARANLGLPISIADPNGTLRQPDAGDLNEDGSMLGFQVAVELVYVFG